MSDFKCCLIALRIGLAVFAYMLDGTAFGQYVNVRATKQVCNGAFCTIQDCLGSGVSLGKDATGRSVVLTAGHCIASPTPNTQFFVGSSDAWVPVTSLGHVWTNAGRDIGLLATKTDVRGAVPISETAPQPGSVVTLHGYVGGNGQKFRVQTAKVIASDENTFTLACIAQSGESGGAVMQDGKLVGLISATGTSIVGQRTEPTFCVSSPCIRRFIMQKLGAMPDCGKPREPVPSPVEPLPQPAPPEEPPAPTPAPTTVDLKPLQDEIAALKAQIAELKNRKLPPIAVELYDEATGALIDRREIPQGEPIKLGNRKQKVK